MVERWEPARFVATCVVIAGAVLLGGGQGGLGDALVQILALGLLCWVGLSHATLTVPRRTLQLGLLLVLLVIAVPLMQLLPLPGLLPGQRIASERALYGLIPAIAVFLSVLTLSPARQRWVVILLLLLAAISLFLGLAQLAQGPSSSLRLYSNTNATQAVGFFANRNHLAALFLMCLPFALALAAGFIGERPYHHLAKAARVALAIFLSILMTFGLALTQSRSGLLLGMVAFLASVPMILALRRWSGMRRTYLVMGSLAVLVLALFAYFGALQRLATDTLGDDRAHFASVTLQAAQDSPFIGTGLGTFRQVFQIHDVETPGRAIVNHAHNDYLELWLEARWPYLVCLLLLLWLFVRQAARIWRAPDRYQSLSAKAASIAVLLILLHSALDFPLRTTSNQAVFALALGILFSWRPKPTESGFPDK